MAKALLSLIDLRKHKMMINPHANYMSNSQNDVLEPRLLG